MDEFDTDTATPESGRRTDDVLAASAFVLSLMSAIAYFASSRGIHNFVVFLIDSAEKALRHPGAGA